MKQYKKPALSSSSGSTVHAVPAAFAAVATAAAVGAGLAGLSKMFKDSIPDYHEPLSDGLRTIENF